jgi:hypothetical protein
MRGSSELRLERSMKAKSDEFWFVAILVMALRVASRVNSFWSLSL